MSRPRHLVVVDIETTGLDPDRHTPLEVAAINLDTDEVIHFAPYLDPHNLAQADPDALRINRYFERGVYKHALSYEATVDQYAKLWQMLRGNTLGGANPRFDAEMLCAAYGTHEEPWHYRLADLESYVAGALGTYPSEMRGLAGCCDALGVHNDAPHSALGDAKAAADCFRKAMAR